ncbi:MAG TPA: hypothetical protein VFR86_03290, partial [Burkholderiaceae bacterium]|nr:hypothetical protein [Burkholderiaceae bacterium]
VGTREQLHLLYDAQPLEIPHTPRHCRHVLSWGGRAVPVIDLGVWVDDAPSRSASGYIGIYGFRERGGDSVQYGALWLGAPPRQAVVQDSAACDLPPALTRLAPWALSCFVHAGAPIVIIDLSALFGLPQA